MLEVCKIQHLFHTSISSKWMYVFPFESITSHYAAQIHHTGSAHWVMSAKVGETIYVCDSLINLKRKTHLTESLQIQLGALYGEGKHKLEVCLPISNQQSNYSDCGLFAVANLINFCKTADMHESTECSRFYLNTYDDRVLRRHHVKCFDNKKFAKKNKKTVCHLNLYILFKVWHYYLKLSMCGLLLYS